MMSSAVSNPLNRLQGLFRPPGDGPSVDPLIKSARSGDETRDVLGTYPTAVRVPALEGRRYLWTTRVFAIGFYLSMLLNIALVMTLYTLVPLKRIEPFLVTFNDEREQIVHIQPFIKGASGMALLSEKMAGEYVKVREEILADQEEMKRRWVEYLKYHMPEKAYLEFLNKMNEPYAQLSEKGVSRTVDIKKIISRTSSHIEVFYTTNDFDRFGKKLLSTNWVARLQIGYSVQNVKVEEQHINPLGFTVMNYSVTQN